MPKFEALAAQIRGRIRSGQLQPGDKLPSIAQLGREFKVSYGTIRGAMLVLKAEKLLKGRQGIGVFVSEKGS